MASSKGIFVYQQNAFDIKTNQPEVAGVGIVTFDGKGNITGSGTNMVAGAPQTISIKQTYTVSSDGIGRVYNPDGHLNDVYVVNSWPPGQGGGSQFLVTDDGTGIPGALASGTSLKQ